MQAEKPGSVGEYDQTRCNQVLTPRTPWVPMAETKGLENDSLTGS